MILSDSGSGISIISPNLFDQLRKSGEKYQSTVLDRTHFISTVDKDAPSLPCSRTVIASLQLKVRHASTLNIRNIKWFVSDRNIPHTILGRDVLVPMGLDDRTLLAAEHDRMNGEIDLLGKQVELSSEGSVAGVIQHRNDELFHSVHCSSDHTVDEDSGEQMLGLDFGEDDPEELRKVLKDRIQEAVGSGISSAGEERLRKLLFEYADVFRLKLGKGPPAKVEPMHIRIKQNAVPIKAKARRYPPKQREFINKFIDRLVNIGFLVDRPTASWHSAPLLVQKPGSSDEYRMTFDVKPVNASTEKES